MAAPDANHELLATELRPLTSATLTIRIIKSFTYRTSKNLVLKDIDLTTTTVGGLITLCKEGGVYTVLSDPSNCVAGVVQALPHTQL